MQRMGLDGRRWMAAPRREGNSWKERKFSKKEEKRQKNLEGVCSSGVNPQQRACRGKDEGPTYPSSSSPDPTKEVHGEKPPCPIMNIGNHFQAAQLRLLINKRKAVFRHHTQYAFSIYLFVEACKNSASCTVPLGIDCHGRVHKADPWHRQYREMLRAPSNEVAPQMVEEKEKETSTNHKTSWYYVLLWR